MQQIPSDISSSGWNRYAYVENDPIRYMDPKGSFLTAEECLDDPELCSDDDGFGRDAGSGYCTTSGNSFDSTSDPLPNCVPPPGQTDSTPTWVLQVGFTHLFGLSLDHLFIWLHLPGVTADTANSSNSFVFDAGPDPNDKHLTGWETDVGHYGEIKNGAEFFKTCISGYAETILYQDGQFVDSELGAGQTRWQWNGPNSNSYVFTLLQETGYANIGLYYTTLPGTSVWVGALAYQGTTQYFTGWSLVVP